MVRLLKRSFLKLGDGRVLAYYASPAVSSSKLSVRPLIVHMHGWPSSCHEGSLMSAQAEQAGFSIVCPDRPGVGGSSPDPHMSFMSVASDVAQLLDHLGVTNGVTMMGASGGGPHACACAALLGPERVSALVLLASMTHTWGHNVRPLMSGMDLFNRLGYNLIAYLPTSVVRWSIWAASVASNSLLLPLLRAIYGRQAPVPETADSPIQLRPPSPLLLSALRLYGMGLPRRDLKSLAAHADLVPSVMAILSDVLGQHGGMGLYKDIELTCAPWAGFLLSSIEVPTAVFQGDEDTCVTPAMAQWLAHSIPGASTTTHLGNPAHQPVTNFALEGQEKACPASERQAQGTGGLQAPECNGKGLHIFHGEGHLSLVLDRLPEIMQMVKQLPETRCSGTTF